MVVLVPQSLLAAVAAFPVLGAVVSRDCWFYRKAAGTLDAPNSTAAEIDFRRGVEKRRRGRVATALVGLLFLWQYYVVVCIVEKDNESVFVSPLFFYHILLMLQATTYICAVFRDPGSAPLAEAESPVRCGRCGARRTAMTHHCVACNRCVDGMDHHCVLIHNCVGRDTRHPYLLLLLYTLFTAFVLWRAGPALRALLRCSVWGWEEGHLCLGAVVTVFLACASVLFALHAFTTVHAIGTLECLEWATHYPYCRPRLAGWREALQHLDHAFGPVRGLWWLPLPRAAHHWLLARAGRPPAPAKAL